MKQVDFISLLLFKVLLHLYFVKGISKKKKKLEAIEEEPSNPPL